MKATNKMKRLLLFGLLFMSLNTSFGQISKKTVIIGGELNMYRALDYNSTFFGLDNSVGFFITDKIVVGGNLIFSCGFPGKNYGIGFVPELRYYIPLGKVYLFPMVKYGFSKNFSNTSGTSSQTRIIGKFGMGMSLFLNEYVSFEPVLYYDYLHESLSNQESKLFTLSIAFQIYLHK